MYFLIAPNSFKNGPGSIAAAKAIALGITSVSANAKIGLYPLSDGGNDFVDVMLFYNKNGKRINYFVQDPLGKSIPSEIGYDKQNEVAFIEMANASGLHLLKDEELNPLKTSTFGTGQSIVNALDLNPKKIMIGLGGSATVDGGLGILTALGIKFFDREGNILPPNGAALLKIHDVDVTGIDKLLENSEVLIASDVENFLLGDRGAARAFGPQKGADQEMVEHLEAGMANFQKVTFEKLRIDMGKLLGGGAAGGVGAGLQAYLNAKLINGAEFIINNSGLKDELDRADVLITGEGKLDEQTFEGKAPFAVAKLAKDKGIKTLGFAGKIEPDFFKANDTYKIFDDAREIASRKYPDLNSAIANTLYDLEFTAKKIISEY